MMVNSSIHSDNSRCSLPKKNCALLIVLFLFTSTVFYGQPPEHQRDWYVGAGAVFISTSVIDNNFSALPFKGSGVAANAFVKTTTPNLEQQLSVLFSKPKLSSANVAGTVSNLYLTADYTRLYTIGNRNADFLFKLGPQLAFLYSKRDYSALINRQKGFEFIGAAGVSAMALYNFSDGFLQGVSLSNRLDLPLILLTQQPAYGSELSEGNIDSENGGGNFFKGSKVQTPGKRLRLQNLLQLTKFWGDKHGLALCYTWNYHQFKEPVSVKQATHLAAISYLLKL